MVQGQELIDAYGRRITYLRLSLTELCNFRCVYCTPAAGLRLLPSSQYLTRNEIVRFVKIIGRLGVTCVRLTGGEPLLREDILEIVRSLRAIDTVKDLSLTTNGSRLAMLAHRLKEAGLDRVNISLDSLDPKRFQAITHSEAYPEVLAATRAALRAGFPVKLNVVVLKGLTGQEIVEFVRVACRNDLEVRFLEFMPLCGSNWSAEDVLPIEGIRRIVHEHFDLEELPREGNVAQTFAIRGGRGKVGFIASLTESFCGDCSRIRLTADGRIRPCLFSDQEVSVKELLRAKAPDEEIAEAIASAVRIKPQGNRFHDNPFKVEDKTIFDLAEAPLVRTIGG